MVSSISKRAAFAILLAGVALTSCRSGGFQSTSDDVRAKSFVVAPGKAAIYVVRPDSIRKTPLSITLDDRLTARTGPCSYLLWEVDPGAHQILAYGENISQLALNTEAGRAYYVRQDVAGGLWSPRTLLMAVDEAAGRKAVSDCRLIDSGTSRK